MNTALRNAVLADLYNFRVNSPQGTRTFETRYRAAAHIVSLRKQHSDDEIEPEKRVNGQWESDPDAFDLADRREHKIASSPKKSRSESPATLKDELRQLATACKLSAAADYISEDHINALDDLIAKVQAGLDSIRQ